MMHDNSELKFNRLDQFIDRLVEVQDSTEWFELPMNQLDVATKLVGITDEDVDTLYNGTKLFVELNHEQIGIRECAMRTLYDKLGLGGELLKRVQGEDLEDYIQFGIKKNRIYRPNMKMKVPVVEGKVNAFLSEGYANDLPAQVVFQSVLNHFQEKLQQEDFTFNGYWSYAQAAGEYFLPIERIVDGEKYEVVLVVKTSDAGYSAINFSAYLTNDGKKKEIPIMSDISLLHKGNQVNSKRLSEMIQMVENAVDSGVKKLNKLLSVVIVNPKNTVKRLAKEVGLPKRDVLEIVEQIEDDPASAFSLYLKLSEIITDDLPWPTKERYQGNIYKLLGISWERFDLPGEFAW